MRLYIAVYPACKPLLGMVSKLTIFEPHFDGAQFGPASIESDVAEPTEMSPDTSAETSDQDGGSRGRSLLIAGLITTAIVVAVAMKRKASKNKQPTLEVDPERVGVPAE